MSLTKVSYSMITGASANVRDFGAVGDGTTDDTAAIQAALNASLDVVIPIGTYLISSTIAIPEKCKVEMQGGYGNVSTAPPATYLIKKSTMTTVGVTLGEKALIVGGGLTGQVGNTGDGIQLLRNNATLHNVYVSKAGGVGVRVGTDGTYSNANSFELYRVGSFGNGSHGIYIHDGVSVGSADANAGTIYQCTANQNGGDGIRLGNCFWNSVINCLTEGNTGYGLYLSGTNNATYPECRWANIVGGDFNEGNNGTVNVNQVYDSSYFSNFINPDVTQFPSNTTTSGLAGAGLRSQFGGANTTSFYGGAVYTGDTNQYPFIVDGLTGGSAYNGASLRRKTTGSNGDGVGLGWSISDGGSNPYVQAAQIQVVQATTNQYNMRFDVYRSGVITAATFNANTFAFTPGADNTWSLGSAALRWSVVYAATGAINTSDANQKQDIESINDAEKATAITIKGLLKKFRFKDAVAEKGSKARIHFGVIAQEVKQAFTANGLEAENYGLFCSDTWRTLNGEVVSEETEGATEVTRLGIRYDELLCFVIAAL